MDKLHVGDLVLEVVSGEYYNSSISIAIERSEYEGLSDLSKAEIEAYELEEGPMVYFKEIFKPFDSEKSLIVWSMSKDTLVHEFSKHRLCRFKTLQAAINNHINKITVDKEVKEWIP